MFSPNQFYQQLTDAFEQARTETGADQTILHLQIGRHQIGVYCTSRTLCEAVRRPLAHLEMAAAPASRPDFRLDLVDASATRAPMPVLPWPGQQISAEQKTQEYREDGYLFTVHGDVMLTGFNEDEGRTVGFVRDPANWPLDHYKQAIFITLYQYLRRQALYLIHASAISRDGRAVLIAGSSGAGKTTTMLTCVRADFQFLGDDTTLIERSPNGGTTVLSLLNTLHVTEQTIDWFPELIPHLSALPNPIGKRLVMVNEVYPGCVAREAQVTAILAPEVSDQAHSTLEPLNKATLLRDILFYSVDLHDPINAWRHLDFLADTLETLPCYRLRLGRDREQLPTLLEQLLGN